MTPSRTTPSRTTLPVLAPGLRVLHVARGRLQVGLSTDHRVVLPDTEAVRRTLDLLRRGEPVPDDPDSREALRRLDPVLVDGGALVAPGVDPGDVAAVALRDPAGFPDRLAARRRTTVAVLGDLGPAADPRPLLTAAGLRLATPGTAAHVTLVLVVGEADRDRLDPLVADGRPHLLVRLVEGTAAVGPFVDPGRTACLRCLDAHRSVVDPLGATAAVRHALARGDRHDGVAEPVDTALAALAVAWAVRDLVTHAEGDRPSTWSTTVDLSPGLGSVTQTQWLRHPACGCGWVPDDQSSRTMSV